MIAPRDLWRDVRVAMLDVEIACVIGERGEIVERRSWLVHPERPIPAEASAIHGITDALVATAPPFCDVSLELLAMLEGAHPAAYNAPFDRAFLGAEWCRLGLSLPPYALRHGTTWIDPLIFAREIQRYEKGGKKLGTVAKRLLIMQGEAHRAGDDAELALRVLYALGKDDRVPRALGDLLDVQARLAAYQEADFQEWKSKQPAKATG